jgi:hypothetical protein
MPFFKENQALHMGCFSHARRKFEDAHKSGSQKGKEVAEAFLDEFRKLFLLEREWRDFSDSERLKNRKTNSVPVLDKLWSLLNEHRALTPPNTKLGRAMTYLVNQWDVLQSFLKHGGIPLSNNWVENCIRPFAVGRRAWLFSATAAGAKASAIHYSLAVSAKVNELRADTYFEYVLDALVSDPNTDPKELLPWTVKDKLLALAKPS